MTRDHADRDAVLQAFALSSPYAAAQTLGLKLAPRSSPRSRSVRVCCPWHGERNAACVLERKRGKLLAKCHACGAGGDVLSIVAALEGLDARRDFGAVLARAGELVGVDVRREREPRAPAPATPLDLARRELAASRHEAARLEAELRQTTTELGIAHAEAVARQDALSDVIAGLSRTVHEAMALVPALRSAARRGTRGEVLAALTRLERALGTEEATDARVEAA